MSSQTPTCLSCRSRPAENGRLYSGPDGRRTLCPSCYRRYIRRRLPLYTRDEKLSVIKTEGALEVMISSFNWICVGKRIIRDLAKPNYRIIQPQEEYEKCFSTYAESDQRKRLRQRTNEQDEEEQTEHPTTQRTKKLRITDVRPYGQSSQQVPGPVFSPTDGSSPSAVEEPATGDLVKLKVEYLGRFFCRYVSRKSSMKSLRDNFCDYFDIGASVEIAYRDDEGDYITLVLDEDVRMMMMEMDGEHDAKKGIRVRLKLLDVKEETNEDVREVLDVDE